MLAIEYFLPAIERRAKRLNKAVHTLRHNAERIEEALRRKAEEEKDDAAAEAAYRIRRIIRDYL